MNRRDRAREKKRKARERRLRQRKHAAQTHRAPEPAPDEDVPTDEAVTDPDAEPAAPFPHFDLHLEERLLRRVARVLALHEDAGQAERERVAAALTGKSVEEIDAEFGIDDVERAQDLAFRAWDTDDSDEMFSLLGQALKLDSGCTDARTLRALLEPRERDALARLGLVIEDAARALGGESALPRGPDQRLDVRVRPYLRARHERMKLLANTGRTAEAIAEGEALLTLDPADGVSARQYLCGALLEAGELVKARELIQRFGGSPDFMWGSVLERFLAGDRRAAALQRRVLVQSVPEVEDLILGTAEPADDDDETALAVEEVAINFLAPVARAWAKYPDARVWLEQGAPETTAAERRAAIESYALPVSALLHLGEPDVGGPGLDGSLWPDYSLVHDLHADDIPELLRMAADPGLHEQDGSTAAVWAPVHAWRALALFAAAGVDEARRVKDVVLTRLLREPDDDWTNADAEHVLSLVGEPALEDLCDILTDRNDPAPLRGIVAGCLAAIGVRHPELRSAVLRTLTEALRDYVEEAEANLAEGYPADNVTEDDDLDTLALVICALSELRGGTGDGGEERVRLVERVMATGIVDEGMCGPTERVVAGMRGEMAE